VKIIIDKIKLAEVKKWFTGYVHTFKFVDQGIQQNIDLKEDHTMRVCKEILNIGEQLGLNDDELRLAEIIALLHDIGRFEQISRYQTFMDSKSVDHAELGIEILKHFEVLKPFDESIGKLIFCSIKYHSKPSLSVDETETCMFFCKLIRDADKLDILNVVTEYYHRKGGEKNGSIVLELPDTPGISEGVYRNLMNRSIVNIEHVTNLNDFKLLQAGWIFDINFQPALDCIKKHHYIQLIREVLPESKEIDEIFDLINATLKPDAAERSIQLGRL
jgi:putative nucleotidyltransferase with HDIG domain